jgi:two-component system chemotaxis response regulator CheB
MRLRVAIATASSFLAVVIRKTLSRSPRLEAVGDHRDAGAALAGLGEPSSLAIVDAELLYDEAYGAALRRELVARRAPAIVIDARQRGVPDDLAQAPSIVVVRGRAGGELDLAVIESELLAAVGSALRQRSGPASAPPTPTPLPRAEVYNAVLELIVLVVSTGVPPLLIKLLEDVSAPAIPMLIVQHMPQSETAGFAERLSEHSGLCVREVANGPLPPPGVIGVLRGGQDFRITRRGSGLSLNEALLDDNPFHPCIDEVLASAVAANVAVGAAILTGMGQDGAAGALAMAQKGLPVIAQQPETCVVAGMPQAAIHNRAACCVQSPEHIASTLNRWSENARLVGKSRGLP